MPAAAVEDEVRRAAFEDPRVRDWVGRGEVRKVVYIPGRLLNVVVAGEGRGERQGLRVAALGSLAALVFAGACGYRVVGIGGQLPGGVTRVEVPVFENQTSRNDIGRVMTEDFISQLLGSAKLNVVTGEGAQALVLGKVTSYKREPITFDSKQKPLENRLTIIMDVSLVTKTDRRLLFGEQAVTVRYDYPVKTDLQENDRLEDQALRAASKQMSQKLVSLMLESF